MSKRFTKIICLMFSVVVAVGAALIAGCSGVYKADPLSKKKGEIFTGEVASNGGFAVEKGNYVYFINGKQNSTADNAFGTPVKGAIYRIAKTDLAARNYSSVDRVVPMVAYSGNQDAGIFIYGDYIYYSTPSTQKTASGAVENSKLDIKRTKLDGTDTQKDALIRFDDNSTQFRVVEVEGVVYILYVGKEGNDDEITTLRSLNVKTGKDTLLAYNVSAVQFDDEDKTNPRVYYTMGVYDYAADENYGYNQVYTVTADVTKQNEYDFTTIVGWNEDKDKGDVDKYVNCGSLVFDGIGDKDYLKNQSSGTPFNFDKTGETRNTLSYNYTLRAYVNGNVFYTRNTNEGSEHLFSVKEESVLEEGWNPVTNNAVFNTDQRDNILNDGSSASDFKYLFNENKELTSVIVADDNGIAINKVTGGKLQTGLVGTDDYFYVAEGGSAKVLFIDGDYLYYSKSVESGNGYSINRVDYTGERNDYESYLNEEDKYEAVRILDLDACSDWYLPELIQGQILFASETYKMTSYNYVMACDIRKDAESSEIMTNTELRDLNEKYEGISDIFDDLGDTDKYPSSTYSNMVRALKYAHYTGEAWDVYIKDLAKACNAELDEDDDRVYSEETHEMYNEFFTPAEDGLWADYQDKKQVNGKEIYANRRDYYYSVIGKMSSGDAKDYAKAFKTEFLESYPENDTTWWESLNTVSKVFFIIGMCAIGILVIGGGVVLTLVLIKRKNEELPEYKKKKKIKVDTTDDKDIDVYSDGSGEETETKE